MKRSLSHLILSGILLFSSSHSFLLAEIESITIKWTALECQQSCIVGLEKQFRNINGVADVIMNQNAGQATLRWKAGVVLTFPPINTAMSMIGLSINDLHIKVRGTISHDARTVTLNSLGDNTRFLLMSPVTPKQYEMVEQFNPQTHILTPAQRTQFLEAQDANQIAIVEGPLFEPERSPPLKLIVERVRFVKAEEVPGTTGAQGTTNQFNQSWGTTGPYSGIPFHGVSGLPL